MPESPKRSQGRFVGGGIRWCIRRHFTQVGRDLDHKDAIPLPFEDDADDVVVATRDPLKCAGEILPKRRSAKFKY